MACTRSWKLDDNDSRINPNGGAIALGHPLGMTGARILLTAAIELHEQNKKYAVITMCIGVGQGYAIVIEKHNLYRKKLVPMKKIKYTFLLSFLFIFNIFYRKLLFQLMGP